MAAKREIMGLWARIESLADDGMKEELARQIEDLDPTGAIRHRIEAEEAAIDNTLDCDPMGELLD